MTVVILCPGCHFLGVLKLLAFLGNGTAFLPIIAGPMARVPHRQGGRAHLLVCELSCNWGPGTLQICWVFNCSFRPLHQCVCPEGPVIDLQMNDPGCFFFFLVWQYWGFELRACYLLINCCTTWVRPICFCYVLETVLCFCYVKPWTMILLLMPLHSCD
jgi:hypothetical protein